MEYSDLANFLNERMRERGLTSKRLSELTGISLKHLEALREGRVAELPSPPYLRGYLLKLGQTLDFDGNDWWDDLKKMPTTKNPGPADELPKNRFKKEPLRKYLPIAVLTLLLIFYFGFRFSKIFGQPVITVSYPSENPTVVNQNSISLIGRVTNADTLQVNSETISAGQNGEWEKTISLQPGTNTVEIQAKKFLGRETKIVRQIIYNPSATNTGPTP